MSRDAHESRSLFNAFVAPSGMFTMNTSGFGLGACVPPQRAAESSTPASRSIFNPLPTSTLWRVEEEVPLQMGERFLDEYQGVQKLKLFDRAHFDDYGAALFQELVPSLLQHNHDLILFPLRGCRQPGILAKVMAGVPEERMVIFNYTYATRDVQQDRIVSELRRHFEKAIPGKSSVSIGIVDTAKGGYGSEHLAEILACLHAGRTQQWAVQFHLIHARDAKPTIAYQIPRHSTPTLMLLWPIFYEVESLLVEDWSEGIGLSVEWNGKTFELKRCSQRGRVLLRDETSVQLIESESISDLVTSLAVDSVNRQMLTDPQLEYVRDVFDPHA